MNHSFRKRRFAWSFDVIHLRDLFSCGLGSKADQEMSKIFKGPISKGTVYLLPIVCTHGSKQGFRARNKQMKFLQLSNYAFGAL